MVWEATGFSRADGDPLLLDASANTVEKCVTAIASGRNAKREPKLLISQLSGRGNVALWPTTAPRFHAALSCADAAKRGGFITTV